MHYDFFGYFISAASIVFAALIIWFGRQFYQNSKLANRLKQLEEGKKS